MPQCGSSGCVFSMLPVSLVYLLLSGVREVWSESMSVCERGGLHAWLP